MIRDWFYIRKSDRLVLLTLLTVMVTALGIIGLTDNGPEPTDALVADTLQRDSAYFSRQYSRQHTAPYYQQEPRQTTELFAFDPNTADSTQLLRLGLKPWQVRNVYKYRSAGGVFRRKQDFAKLYGLTAGEYKRLEPYISITADYQPASERVEATPKPVRDTLMYPKKIGKNERVVLNTADTTVLRTVPGIGVYFAHEIVKHGKWLGGYVSVDQLDEIDGFPQQSKAYFVVENPQPKKLNLNRLTLNELKRHPYISFYQAKAIVDYRRLRGPLRSLQDLQLLPDFTPEKIARLEPYVEF